MLTSEAAGDSISEATEEGKAKVTETAEKAGTYLFSF